METNKSQNRTLEQSDTLIQQLGRIEVLLQSQALSNKSVFSIDEVAIYTGLSKLYIYKLSCRKDIPCYKPGGKQLYFKRDEIDKWLLRNRQSTKSEIESEVITQSLLRKK